MSDPFDPPEPPEPVFEPSPKEEGGEEGEHGPFPWDDPPPEDPDAPRQRHDAFTEARKCEFLRALVKTGCIEDACRRVGVGRRTVYRHQEDSPSFFDNCRLALRMSGTPIELTAWQRAVEGVEQEFAVGGEVRVRRRYDGGLLRLLLQGSNPGKYGPRPGFKRKRLLKHEKKQLEREIRAQIEAESQAPNRKGPPERSFADTVKSIMGKIEAIERHGEPKKLAAGWTKSPEGRWIPPGYGPIPGWQAPPQLGDGTDGEETPRDSI